MNNDLQKKIVCSARITFGGIMSDTLRARYQRESFFPTWLGMFINPFYCPKALVENYAL